MSQNKTKIKERERFFFIDLSRLLSMVAIAHFHLHEALIYNNSHNHIDHGFIEIPLVHYSRFMSFSGYSIIILSYFLIGFIGFSKRKLKQILSISIVGAVAILVIFYEGGQWSGEWDIYPHIAVASLIISLLSGSMRLMWATSFVFFIAICLPPETWQFPSLQNFWFYNPVFGNYEKMGAGSWPLLPWLGISIIPFTLGKFLRLHPKHLESLRVMKKNEILIWVLILFASASQWGRFHAVPIGSDFYKFTHLISRVDLFSHLSLVALAIRLGFVQSINRWAQGSPWVSWISKLYINKKFFLSYLVIWFVIGLFGTIDHILLQSWVYFDLAVFSLIPISEWVCHILIKSSKEIRGYLSSRLRAAP